MPVIRPTQRGTVPQLLAMEGTKLASLPSTLWILLLGAMAAVAVTVIATMQVRSGVDPDEMAQLESVSIVDVVLVGPNMVTVLFVIAFGAIVITGEYSSGMIRTTLAAAPQRGRLMAAKAGFLAATTWVFGALVTAACWTLAGLLLPTGFDAGAGTFVQLLATSATWLTIVALLTFGFGTALRSTAAAVTLSFGLLAVLPVVAPLIAGELGARIVPYTLQEAAFVMLTGEGGNAPAAYGRLPALFVLCAWVAAALAAGYGTLKGRDA